MNEKTFNMIMGVMTGLDKAYAEKHPAVVGNMVVTYFSNSHKKQRYFMGFDSKVTLGKSLWSYNQADAMKLSFSAANMVVAATNLSGYSGMKIISNDQTMLDADIPGSTVSLVDEMLKNMLESGDDKKGN